MGEVERVGSGIRRMREAARAAKVPPPKFEATGFFTITFKKPAGSLTPEALTPQVTPEVTGQVGGQVTGQVAEQVLQFCRTPRKASEIQELLGLRHRETFADNYLRPLLEKGWLERTISDKPRSRLQKYRLTEKGRKALGKAK